jgi:hypothetical protein
LLRIDCGGRERREVVVEDVGTFVWRIDYAVGATVAGAQIAP